jgi:hypothetical protein
VDESSFVGALFASAFWAVAITIAQVIASVILMLVVLELEVRRAGIWSDIAENGRWAAYGPGGKPTPPLFYDWLAGDAILFALHLGLVLLVANRMNRLRGPTFVAPAVASALAFVIEHIGAIARFLSTLDPIDFEQLMRLVVAEFFGPFEAIAHALAKPKDIYDGAIVLLVESEASYFQLATCFPWLFFVIAIGFAVRHLFFGSGGETPEMS